MSNPITNMECWQDLANAIIIKAAEDFRATLRRLKLNPENPQLARDEHDLEQFFTSKWFSNLTTLDGAELLQTLKRGI